MVAVAAGLPGDAYPERHEPWLRSRAWDRLFVVGGALLVPIPILCYYGLRGAGLGVGLCEDLATVLVMVLVGGPHVFATYTRTFFEPRFRRRERRLMWAGVLVAAVVIGSAVASAFFDVRLLGQPPMRFLLTFFFFWAGIHIVQQHSYCAAHYAERDGPRRRDWRDALDYLVMLGALFPVAFFRMSMADPGDVAGTTADPSALATRIVVAISGNPAAADDYVFRIGRMAPILPDFVHHHGFWIAVTALFFGVVALFAWKSWDQHRRGTLLRPRFALVVTAATLCFLTPLVPNLDTAFQGLNAWHSFQYLGLAWLMNRRSFDDRRIESRWIRSLSAPGRQWRYYRTAVLATLGLVALIVGVGVAIEHLSAGKFVIFGHEQAPRSDDGAPLYRPGSLLLAYYMCGFSVLLVHYLHDGISFWRKEVL